MGPDDTKLKRNQSLIDGEIGWHQTSKKLGASGLQDRMAPNPKGTRGRHASKLGDVEPRGVGGYT